MKIFYPQICSILVSRQRVPIFLQEQQMLEQYFKQDWQNYWRPYNAMKCASLMRETLWSMVSEIYSEIDFDYAAYTAENLSRFNVAMSDFKQT